MPIAAHSGLRALVIAGTCLTALQYPLLAAVHGVGVGLFALCVVASLGDTFYWSGYHAYFAALGNHEHRGSEVGAREAIAALVGIVSPLVTGWALFTLGPAVAFGATALILLSAAPPLLWTPDIVVPRHVPHAIRGAIPGMQLFLADGWIAPAITALAPPALVGAAAGLLLGRHIDAGHGRSAVAYALSVLVLTTILRAAAPGHALLAITANALGASVVCLYIPTLMTAVYNVSYGLRWQYHCLSAEAAILGERARR